MRFVISTNHAESLFRFWYRSVYYYVNGPLKTEIVLLSSDYSCGFMASPSFNLLASAAKAIR